jgi:SAM-dependent methyltransferase
MQDFWDTRYSETEYAYGTEPNSWFRETLEGRSPGRLYLPGEGEGRNAAHAARLGWEVDAVDYSEAGKEKALRLAADSGVSFRYDVADLAAFTPPAEHFDAAALIFLHLPAPLRSVVHARAADALRPGGVLIVEAFAKEQLAYGTGGPKNEEMLYDMATLKEDFREMEFLTAERVDTELAEGPYHSGRSAVIRLLLRKT